MAGKNYRKGINLIQLLDLVPDEQAARKWFEETRWPNGRACARCGSIRTRQASHATMPYWCSDCRKYFSVKTGTVLRSSNIPLRKWVIAFYQVTTNLKGVSSMKLHRDIAVSQPTAWFMLHRIRKAMESGDPLFSGPVEVDETFIGDREANKHQSRKIRDGRGPVGKAVVVGIKHRESNQVDAKAVRNTGKQALQGFVYQRTDAEAIVYTDESSAYKTLPRRHMSVRHGAGEYVRDMAHTNGMESFWAMMKRGVTGTYHKMSVKHLHRYVSEFKRRHNDRPFDTLAQMRRLVRGAEGKQLRYAELTA